jgi:hypothetical protein
MLFPSHILIDGVARAVDSTATDNNTKKNVDQFFNQRGFACANIDNSLLMLIPGIMNASMTPQYPPTMFITDAILGYTMATISERVREIRVTAMLLIKNIT